MAKGKQRPGRGARPARRANRQLSVERLESRIAMAAQPIISEILASNSGVIQDADGDDSDFIELYNAGDEAINLAGWHLTDDDERLDKWTLPAVNLGAGQYLVIFASGKNRAIAGSQLHTNFALGADGEFLALVRPDLSIASQFAPAFPAQYEDVSYGFGGDATETILADLGSTAHVLVPPNGALGTSWTQAGFVPGLGWQSGALGAGYNSEGVPPTPTTVLQVDFNGRASAGNTMPGFSPFVLSGGSTVFSPTVRTFGATTVTVSDASGMGYTDRSRSAPVNGGAFTEATLLQDFIFSLARDAGGGGLDVTITGLVPGDVYTLTAWSYDAISSGLRTSDWTANGVSVEDYSFDGSSSPLSNESYRMGFVVTADNLGHIVLQGRQDEESSDYGVFLNALRVETGDTISPSSGVIRVDFNASDAGESGAANTESGYATMTLEENGATIDGVKITFSGYNGGKLESRDRDEPIASGSFTLDQVYDDFIFVPSQAGAGMEILIEGLAPNVEYDLVLRSLDALGSGERQANWTEVSGAAPVTIAAPYTYNGAIQPTSNDQNAMRARLTTSPQGTLILRGVQVGGSTSVFVNGLELSRSSLQEYIGVDMQEAMADVNSSAYIRVPFNVANPAAIDQLLMDVRYDAGFVAYLNGQEVARRNAPTAPGVAPAYNAAATLERANSEALLPETIDLSAFKHLLTAGGGNVLAIHGLNSAAADDDFLIAPQLRAVEVSGGSLRFFETPTPGAPNGEGVIDLVGDVQLSVPHGFYNAPFSLALSTPTAGASVYYTYDGSVPAPDNPSAFLYSGPIQVNRTSIVRAGAVLEGYGSSSISTATYIFLDDVVNQSINPSNPASNPFGLSYPPIWQANAPADFNMDPRVTGQWDDNNPSNSDFGIREALQSIPTMSIVMDHDDLWNASTGIYPRANNQGDAWRRAGSIEFVDPATGEEFQYNVGVQMHGAASRDNVRTKKHSFRLVFNSEFDGPGRLNFPLFDNSNFADINTVVLKAAFTDSFATRTATGRYSPLDSTYTRDVWMLDSQRAMGHLAPDATYVHLYVNGLYWGLYYPTERVDDAYLSSRLGGSEEDWDVIKDFSELFRGDTAAWDAMFGLARRMSSFNPTGADAVYQQLQGRNADGTPNASMPVYLDVDNLIDYMILHIYAGVEDWPSHNWVAARNRVNPGTGFRFYTWDQEIALDGRFRDRTEAFDAESPAELYALLQNSPEFRLRFADRVQKHLFGDGALTVEAATERWLARADQIEAAIIAESARWGDAREGEFVDVPPASIIPLMTVNQWRGSVADVVAMLPQYHSLAVSRLQADALFTTLAAPQLSHNGGPVAPGHMLSMTAPGGGTIYYTTNGEDPRDLGGGLNGDAAVYSGAVTINSTTTVKARVRTGSTWSALTEATFGVLQGSGGIVISELNYHPHAPSAAEAAAVPGVQEDDFEFIEILNTHPTDAINLQNMSLAGGLSFTFGNVMLGPGQRGVVVESVAAFEARYGTGHTILGSWSGGASNSGESIELRSSTGSVIMAIDYIDMDPWSEAPDGDGASLELIDPFNTPAERLGKWYSWRASTEFGGTPGAPGQGAIGVVINEVRSRATSSQSDAIELHNTTNQPVNVGGWYLSDSGGNPLKFRIPTGTVIAAGGYLVFDEDDFNPLSPAPGQTPFALNGFEGDDVFLVIPNGAGSGVSKIVDSVHFGASLDGETLGRLPNAAGRLAPMASTLGAANTTARVGSVVITEVGYRPGAPSAAAIALDPSITAAQLEFIEIYNRTGATVDLTNYRLAGDVEFDLPPGTVIGAGQTIVLVPFNASTNPAKAAAFRAHYGVSPSVALLGPFTGSLLDGGARVELQVPDSPPPDMPALIPRITSDEVLYDNLAPWASIPPGSTTLQRTIATSYGNAAASWQASAATPGSVEFVVGTQGDFDQDGDVDGRDFLAWQRGLGATSGATRGQGDADGDGDVDASDLGRWKANFGADDSLTIASVGAGIPAFTPLPVSAEPKTLFGLVSHWRPSLGEDPEREADAGAIHLNVVTDGRVVVELHNLNLRRAIDDALQSRRWESMAPEWQTFNGEAAVVINDGPEDAFESAVDELFAEWI